MKIIIIGSRKVIESKLLKGEAEKRNHHLKIVPLTRLIFKGDKKLSILLPNKQELSSFDAILFRAINKHIIEAKIIAKYMRNNKRIIIDEILARGNYDYHKFLMHSKLWEAKIPQPKTFYPLNLKKVKYALKDLKTPIIIKHIKEMKGRSVFRFDTKKEALNFFIKNKKYHYLIQEWYPSKKYYRVLVLGNKAFGAIERLSLKCKKRPKILLEKRSKKTELTSLLKNLALRAAKATGIEFAGVDIMPNQKDKLSVLEVNRSPQFKRFMKVTGINVAEEIIKYIEKKKTL